MDYIIFLLLLSLNINIVKVESNNFRKNVIDYYL